MALTKNMVSGLINRFSPAKVRSQHHHVTESDLKQAGTILFIKHEITRQWPRL